MKATEKIALAERNIRQALADYHKHTSQTAVLDDVSDYFIERLAKDNYYAKQELRELFRKSPVWDEQLDALVINGSRTHDPDYSRIHALAREILDRPLREALGDNERIETIFNAIYFFSDPDPSDEARTRSIAALNALAPKAYAPRKKQSRIFRALCVALGVTEETCERFPYLYAQLADEMTSHKIDFKLFVSLNPAHFLTMSNPREDKRGCTLTSCHSFNSTEYEYNNGCTGYARDHYTFIVFTVIDPTNAETLNNRKNRRQIFCYKPGNGVLLQSRLYNDAGGTRREQAESKIYRDLVQREISALEDQPNLWRTFKYYGNSEIMLPAGHGFKGYPDWMYEDFEARISIRADHEGDYERFEIGTYGICVHCGEENSDGVYCYECGHQSHTTCAHCGRRCDESALHDVIGRNGSEINVCGNCRESYYSYCEICDHYHHDDNMTKAQDGSYICKNCRDNYFSQCRDCGDWVRTDELWRTLDAAGQDVYVCEDCFNSHYVQCDNCDDWAHEDGIKTAYDENGNEHNIGPCCINDYAECEDCGRLFKRDLLTEGLCPDCAAKIAPDEEDEKERAIA